MNRQWRAIGALAGGLAMLFVNCSRQPPDRQLTVPKPTVVTTAGGVEMVSIPGGEFSMGSDRGGADELPIHKLSVQPFLMDRYEVTQEEYAKFVIGNPSRFKDPRRPVEQIRWLEAISYCNARSLAEGLEPCYDEETGDCNVLVNGYRLPSEAEWEYACRAGRTTEYGFGSDPHELKEFAWYRENANDKTPYVGRKKPNVWGLFDMHGSVAEWCNDRYAEDYYAASPPSDPRGPASGEKRVVRGGAWNSSADGCRSASRRGEVPGSFADACFAHPEIGFRCVRTLLKAEGRLAPPPAPSPKRFAAE